MQKEQFIGRELIGGYTLQEILGGGGFGVAFLATYQHDNSLVAVKLFDPVSASEDMMEFRQEAKRLAYLHHPHIIQFYWHDVERVRFRDEHDKEMLLEYPFIVMMYANKGSVRKYTKEKGIMPTEEAVGFLVQAAQGIQHAHDRKFIHRDIKPDNLLLHQHPGNDHMDVLVSDFGIAVTAHTERSFTPQDISLSPPYAAPEQFSGKATTVSDVYALGVTTFELLTGQRPFKANGRIGYEYAHTILPPPSFREVRQMEMNEVLGALEEVVAKALAKNPQDRYDSVGAFSHDLNERYIKAVEEQERQKRLFDENQVKRKLIFEQGWQLVSQGQYEEALQALDEAVGLNPNDSDIFRGKALALAYLGRYREALQALDEAIRLNPNDSYTFRYRGEVLIDLGKHEEALRAYDEAIRLNPNDDLTFRYKGEVLLDLSRYEEALRTLNEAIRFNPNDSNTFWNKGLALVYLGRYEEALHAFDEAIRLSPNDSNIFSDKGLALLELSRYEEALQAYEKALELDPTNKIAQQEIAEIKKSKQFIP